MLNKNRKKLPTNIAQMVEKNNLVLAIKTLSVDEGISFDEAKDKIDAYEVELKQKQQVTQQKIAKKQAKTSTNANLTNKSFETVPVGADKRSTEAGYKKLLLPYWGKQRFVIILLMLIILWGFWQFIA